MHLSRSTVALSITVVATTRALAGCSPHNSPSSTSTSLVRSSMTTSPSPAPEPPSSDEPESTDRSDGENTEIKEDEVKNDDQDTESEDTKQKDDYAPADNNSKANSTPSAAPAPTSNNEGSKRQPRRENAQHSETYQVQPWEKFTVKHPVVENEPCGPDIVRGATGQTDKGKPLRCSDSTSPTWILW